MDIKARKTKIHWWQKSESKNRFFAIRNLLNTIFIIIAVIGVYTYSFTDSTKGTIIVLVAMAFKIVECILRFIK